MNENKTNINCLPCIYTVHRLNLYKIEFLSKWDLASFNKKSEKNEKKGQKLHIFKKN